MEVESNRDIEGDLRRISFPYPILQIHKRAELNHINYKRIIDQLIKEYMNENTPQIEKIYDYVFELMEYDINLEKPSKEFMEKFYKHLEEVDSKLKYVNQFLEDLAKNKIIELKEIWLKYFEDSINIYEKIKSYIKENLIKKEGWDQFDSLMYTYIDVYILNLKRIYKELYPKNNKEEILKNIYSASFFVLIYNTVIYAYFKGKLKLDILLNRLAELTSSTEIPTEHIDKKSIDILNEISTIPPLFQ